MEDNNQENIPPPQPQQPPQDNEMTNSETDDSEKSAPESIDSHVSDSDGGHWYDDFFGVYGAAFDDEIDFGTPLPSDSDVGQSDGEDNNNLEAVQIALQQPQQQEHNDGDDVNEHQQPQQEKAEAFDPGVAIVIPTKSKSGRCTKRVIYPSTNNTDSDDEERLKKRMGKRFYREDDHDDKNEDPDYVV